MNLQSMANRSGMMGGRLQFSSGSNKKSNVNTMLPQGGFQSVNLSIVSQDRCKIVPNPVIPDNTDYVGEGYGYGSQDYIGEAYGVEDTDDLAQLQSTKEPSTQDKLGEKEELKRNKLKSSDDDLLQIPKDLFNDTDF